MSLVVAGCSTDGLRALKGHVLVGEEGYQREESQQRRGCPADRLLSPLPLRLEAQALSHLLKSGLHLPASYEPGDDQLWGGIEVGTEQGLSLELFFRIADQNPAQRNGG